ncbi:unnamed protein product [Prunus armeniaca]
MGALKNADWDPLLPRAGKRKKASAVLSRPSTPAVAVPRVAAPPLARATIVTSTAAPTSRAPAMVGAQKTLEHRTVPSAPPARPIAPIAPGRKKDREALSTEAAPAESVAVETAVLERPRKRVLLVLSEGEDEEEVLPVIVSKAPSVTGEAVAEELAEEVAAAEVAVEGRPLLRWQKCWMPRQQLQRCQPLRRPPRTCQMTKSLLWNRRWPPWWKSLRPPLPCLPWPLPPSPVVAAAIHGSYSLNHYVRIF